MKKKHSTNYFDTFIEVAEDTKRDSGTKPPAKERKTVAEMQYDYIAAHPYQYTSDDVLFRVFADRKDLTKAEEKEARKEFFSKGQPCFRASPLTKMYGFGIHCNSEGNIALYGMETEAYQKFVADPEVKKVNAMKSGK